MNKHYIYNDGPVYNTFNDMIETRWYGETDAPTREKAISNLKYQFREEYNMMSYAKLYFDPDYLISEYPAPIKLKNDLSEPNEESKNDMCEQLCLKIEV